MNQSNLLELAKQGEPRAIAALINAVLTPRGIVAQVEFEAACLEVFLESTRTVNQEKLVDFIRKGLLELGAESIQTVRVYGRKFGENDLDWSREFKIESIAELTPVESPEQSAKVIDATLPLEEASYEAEGQDDVEETDSEAEFEEEAAFEQGSLSFSYLRTYSIPFFLVAVVGFIFGGMAASISTSQAENQTVSSGEGVLLTDETRKLTLQEKQQQAESYLKAMNVAQENFYRQNNRFATSLEELERSTNLIFQSYDYSYKLKVTDASRAEITALPSEDSLRSYVSAVFLTESGTTSVICKTKKPSPETLPKPEFSKSQLKCSARSIQVK
jgi:Tfp pilus assembly protein PilE